MSDFNPSRKIGIKLLDQKQLTNVFPQVGKLLKHIKYQRERVTRQNAGNESAKKLIEHEYYLMHDNIFGIFGGRGSGKTSVMFSLREVFLKESKTYGDIVLPIIMPEIIDNESSLLGWVLAIIGDVVEDIECDMKRMSHSMNNQEFMHQNIINFFENCRFNEQNKLREEYDLIYRECFSSTSSIVGQYSYVDTVSIKAEQSRKQYQLMKKLNKFWNLLVNTKHQIKCYETKLTKSEQDTSPPLIFMIFDDIDLAPERSKELLTSAFKFFSNPNIVIIITAAIKTLEQVLVCKMYNNVLGSHEDNINGQEVKGLYSQDDARKDAKEYLNKVIPPSSRYFLERYDTCEQKLLFSYSRESDEYNYNPERVTSKPIVEFLADLIRDFEGSDEENFLLQDKSKLPSVENFNTTYLLIFGNKNRYIFNGCLEIMNALEKMNEIMENQDKNNKMEIQDKQNGTPMKRKGKNNTVENKRVKLSDYREIYYVLNHLLSVLINSNVREVVKYEEFISKLLLLHKGEWRLYINYALLLELYDKESLRIRRKIAEEYQVCPSNLDRKSWDDLLNQEMRDQLAGVKKPIGILFITLFFIENLLAVMMPQRGSIHGHTEIIDFLNRDINVSTYKDALQIKLFKSSKKVGDIISVYGLVLENPSPFVYLDIFKLEDINTCLSTVYYDTIQKETLKVGKLKESCIKDYYWSKTILSMLFISNSGLLSVNKEYYFKYNLFLENLLWWEFGEVSRFKVNEIFAGLLKQNDMSYYSKELMKQFKEVLIITDLEKNPECIEPEVEVELIKKNIENLFHEFESDRSKDVRLQTQCKKFWIQFGNEIPLQEKTQKRTPKNDMQDFARRIIHFVEEVIESNRVAFIKNDYVVRVDPDHVGEVIRWIDELGDISPIIDAKGEELLRQLSLGNEFFDGQRTIRFSDFYQFMTDIRSVFKNPHSGIDETYFRFLPELIEYCPVYEGVIKKGKSRNAPAFSMFELVLNLHLSNYLAPFYFAAKFIDQNSSEYSDFENGSENAQVDLHQASFTKLYKDITNYVELDRNKGDILTKTFHDAKADVVTIYLQKIEF